jgi:hypothetical protein
MTQPEDKIARIITWLSFFYPFDTDHRDVEVPQLVQKAPQGSLVSEGTDQDGATLFVRDDGYISHPIHEMTIQILFDPDAVSVWLVYGR